MTPRVGDRVRVEMSKWGGRPHWEFEAFWLGNDVHGDWIGIPAGTPMARPGAYYEPPVPQVGLAPGAGLPDADRGWVATFHAEGGQVSVYVDITTPPTFDGVTLRTIDLDLDVVRGTTGQVWVDDEDEFAEHRLVFGYPEEVVAAATASCDRVERLLSGGHPPYDGSHLAWLDRLAELEAAADR